MLCVGDYFVIKRSITVYMFGDFRSPHLLKSGSFCLIVEEKKFTDKESQFIILTSHGWPFYWGKNFVDELLKEDVIL